MDKVFVDASVFVALSNERDVHHKKALQMIKENLSSAITSDHVFDEVLSVVARKVNREKAIEIGKHILQAEIVVARTNEAVFQKAWQLFQKESLSFTDCTSFAIMERLELDTAFSFDSHFEAMKFRVVPR